MNLFPLLRKALVGYPTYLHNRRDFIHFYDQYAPMVYGYLLGRTEDVSLADSILADVFLTFWQERIAFNEHQSVTTKRAPLSWLLRIAHRKEFEHQSPVNLHNLLN